jgi:hypothetical protein
MNSFSSFPNRTSAAERKTRQHLERMWQVSAPDTLPTVPIIQTSWYRRCVQWLVRSLTDSQQVRVWTKITPNGTQWNAYDPQCDRRFSGYSEADLRTWLEQRHR